MPFSNKRNQGSLEKRLMPRLGQGKIWVHLIYLILENMKILKKKKTTETQWGISLGRRSHFEGISSGQIRGNLSIKVKGLPRWHSGKESACQAGDMGLISGSGRSPGEGNGNPLQYSCLENPWTEEPGGLQSVGCQRVGHD